MLQHAVRSLEAMGDRFDAVCLLQPTNPLRRSEWIDTCIELLEHRNASAVVTVLPIPTEHNPHWVYLKGEDDLLHLSTGEETPIARRQDLPPAYHREGSVYVTRRGVLIEGNSLYGARLVGHVLVEPEHCVNINGPEDWQRAETLLRAEKLCRSVS